MIIIETDLKRLPETCAECKFGSKCNLHLSIFDPSQTIYYCKITDTIYSESCQGDNCPLEKVREA